MKRTYTIPLATLALCLLALVQKAPTQASTAAIRPVHDYVPQAGFSSLRKRIAQTRWPDKGSVSGQVLVHYRGTGCGWRKAEVEINALPRHMTLIDEVDEVHG